MISWAIWAAAKSPDSSSADFPWRPRTCWKNSRAKLRKKNLDMIVANNLKVKGAGFGTDTNVVTIITADMEKELELMSKDEVAARLLDEILARI